MITHYPMGFVNNQIEKITYWLLSSEINRPPSTNCMGKIPRYSIFPSRTRKKTKILKEEYLRMVWSIFSFFLKFSKYILCFRFFLNFPNKFQNTFWVFIFLKKFSNNFQICFFGNFKISISNNNTTLKYLSLRIIEYPHRFNEQLINC